MLLKRCKYRASGGSDKAAPVERLPIPENFGPVLDVATDYYRAIALGGYSLSRETIAAEFFQTAAIDWFESVTKMRVGEYLARCANGEQFEWQRDNSGVVRLVSIAEKVTVN